MHHSCTAHSHLRRYFSEISVRFWAISSLIHQRRPLTREVRSRATGPRRGYTLGSGGVGIGRQVGGCVRYAHAHVTRNCSDARCIILLRFSSAHELLTDYPPQKPPVGKLRLRVSICACATLLSTIRMSHFSLEASDDDRRRSISAVARKARCVGSVGGT